MGFLDFFKKEKPIKGIIGFLNLSEWWLSEFSDEERKYIHEKYSPTGFSNCHLTSDEITHSSETHIRFLTTLAMWFLAENARYIAHRMIKKAESFFIRILQH